MGGQQDKRRKPDAGRTERSGADDAPTGPGNDREGNPSGKGPDEIGPRRAAGARRKAGEDTEREEPRDQRPDRQV
ncbi:hypothetical protein [Streptomyces sp. cmx-4-9]|uniref:hypothetical protein n=1 Tax=Streptomyces sp. cmx-4-9 TaxID=2790941 RepID=UPI0039812B2B